MLGNSAIRQLPGYKWLRALVIRSGLLLFLLLNGCVAENLSSMPQDTTIPGVTNTAASHTVWYGDTSREPKAVVLVIAGMNNKPEIMLSLIEELTQHGLPCLLLKLTGQAQLPESHVDYTHAWRNEIQYAYSVIKQRYPAIPIYNLSYSLGASVSLAYQLDAEEQKFQRALFLAPALAFTSRMFLIRVLLPFRHFGVSLPSLALPEYRTHHKTPLEEYSHAFSLQRSIRKGAARPEGFQKMNALPTLILMSKNDELVSFYGMQDFLAESKLNNWVLRELHPEPSLNRSYEHLIVDEASLGKASWDILRHALLEHFEVLSTEKASQREAR